jgi:4a-hydroxytetrahydrobiopterin dehydratase
VTDRIPSGEAARRLRALVSGGVGPGFPRKRRDTWILLGSCASSLPAGERDERSLNEKLKEWLTSQGPRVDLDHVTIRRALVDEGFVERTADGARYERSRAHESRVVFVEDEMALAREKCVPCRGDAPKMSASEIEQFARQVPAWKVMEENGEPRLVREFKFKDFSAALAFANKVGAAAEEEDHHPALLVEYGKVTVSWWTHAIGGLHHNDFVMAAKTDELAS